MDNTDAFSNIASNIIWIGTLVMVLFVIGLIVYATKYNKRIMNTKPKQRFKYLDTFYYSYYSANNDDTVGDTIYVIFNIVSDLTSNIIYAIPESSFTNCVHSYINGKFKIMKGRGFATNFKDVDAGTEGSLWIDKEYGADYYKHDGEFIVMGKDKLIYSTDDSQGMYVKVGDGLFKKKYSRLTNINPQYDISLLDKAVFVYGVAEFDIEQ